MSRIPPPNGRFDGVSGFPASTARPNPEDERPDFDAEPTVDMAATLLTDSQEVQVSHSLVTDEVVFRMEKYNEKLADLVTRLEAAMKELRDEPPPPMHLRVEHCNVISFIVTVSELFMFVADTSKKELTNVPCQLIDKMDEWLPSLHLTKQYGHAELYHFAQLLEFRDEVMECLQQYYRIKRPMERNDRVVKPRKEFVRYTGYDGEWLCGSILSGPYYLNCARYACSSALQQQTIQILRGEVMAAYYEMDVRATSLIRLPPPYLPRDPRILMECMESRAQVYRRVSLRYNDAVRQHANGTPMELFHRVYINLAQLQADIRKKKKSAADMMLRADHNTTRACSVVIATMASVEAILLIIHKAYALYVDQKHGMYGYGFPMDVARAAAKVFLETSVDKCRSPELPELIQVALSELREEAHRAVRTNFVDLEKKCELQYTGIVEIEIDQDENQFPYNVESDEFPKEINMRAEYLVKNLYLEEMEIRRLKLQLAKVKRAMHGWPDPNIPFVLNACRLGVISFQSNFEDVMHCSILYKIHRQVRQDRHIMHPDYKFGVELLKGLHKIIEDTDCVPSSAELTHEIVTMLKASFGEQVIDGSDASDYANEIVDAVKTEIAVCDLRKSHTNQLQTAATAKRIAEIADQAFLTFIQEVTAPKKEEVYVEEDTPDSCSSSTSSLVNLTPGDMEAHMANMALLFQSLTINSDEEEEGEDCHRCPHVCHHCSEVPEVVIEAFLGNVIGVDLGPLGDHPLYNVPLD
ncbi:hypothetical protein CAEBREN_08756 [Caenorhabditis brenneri]|uniref:Uncharacterized protein n=1 Tax=Caenorhabditis brenneri TaxID=135651 RepID=G0MSU9_CAEBE|nr:hypothetical protein CAEBREN_08756 [Caenorhabditis brenneri]